MRNAQRGASLALVVLALALVVAAMLALQSMTRTTDRDTERKATLTKIARAQTALEQYAVAYRRLPCPADPTQGTGLEVPNVNGLCTNLANLGTLPWATLGLRAEDGRDTWGVKLSYAVYNAASGSATAAGGLDATNCDTSETGGVQGPVPLATAGQCLANHSTGFDKFLPSNKGLKIREANKPNVDDAAYVIISHGPTGRGGYLANNAWRAEAGSPEEKINSRPGSTFHIFPWSGSDVEAAEPTHFDDLVAYMTLKELVTRIGLTPRIWKFEGELARATFNADTIGAALNRPVTQGDLGTNTLVIGSVGAATLGGSNLGLGEITLADGTTVQGIGVAGGGTAILSSTASGTVNGLFGFQFGMAVRHLGVALAGFGKNGAYAEQVRFTFYNVSGGTFTQLGAQVVKTACLATGDFTTLSVQPTVAGTFNAVLVEPRPSTDGSTTGPTAFLVSQAMACSATATSCYPPMATPVPLPVGMSTNRCY